MNSEKNHGMKIIIFKTVHFEFTAGLIESPLPVRTVYVSEDSSQVVPKYIQKRLFHTQYPIRKSTNKIILKVYDEARFIGPHQQQTDLLIWWINTFVTYYIFGRGDSYYTLRTPERYKNRGPSLMFLRGCISKLGEWMAVSPINNLQSGSS